MKIATLLAIHRDFELMELLDELGYHEAWIGEHQLGGWEIHGSPGLFIAACQPNAPGTFASVLASSPHLIAIPTWWRNASAIWTISRADA